MIVYPSILPVYLGDLFFMIYIILLHYKKKTLNIRNYKKTKLNKNTKICDKTFRQ